MKNLKTSRSKIAFVFSLALIIILAACSSTQTNSEGDGSELDVVDTELGGAEIWARRCDKCHYSRPTETLADYQWDVVARHMRVRAKLNGAEERKILEFLKSGN